AVVEKDKREPATSTKPVVEKKAEVTTPKPVVKAPPKKVVKPKPKPVYRSRSVTATLGHRVVRNDGVDVDPKSHEFLGATRLWFPELKDYRWKDRFRSVKKGQVKLYLDKPVSLSRIVINKASVGRLSFKDGEVSLSVQDGKGKWTELFERIDDDVDIKVTITKPREALRDVKAVILRFKSPEPIRIGPIDLIR
ncbi:MAG TPA: hypothetical protein VKA23_02695, partial [Mariprofundaceae bacterium]|nr:hypothetical protein [Mariprofundaceae bacterium]